MKKIFVTGDNLLMTVVASPTHNLGTTTSSFAIDINFWEEKKIQDGKLIIYGTDTLYQDELKTLLSFRGAMTSGEKEPVFLTGMCEKGEDYENCYLLVAEDEILNSNISRQQFVQWAKEYCASREIPVNEDGNIKGEGFPLFESLPKKGNAPAPMLLDKNKKGLEIYTILHDDYFPIMYNGENRFGKFITDSKIKLFFPEEVSLLGKRVLVS